MKKLTDERIKRLTEISNMICDVAIAAVMVIAAVVLLALGWIGLAFALREGVL